MRQEANIIYNGLTARRKITIPCDNAQHVRPSLHSTRFDGVSQMVGSRRNRRLNFTLKNDRLPFEGRPIFDCLKCRRSRFFPWILSTVRRLSAPLSSAEECTGTYPGPAGARPPADNLRQTFYIRTNETRRWSDVDLTNQLTSELIELSCCLV